MEPMEEPARSICVILAGGQSRRMGRDKAALPMGNATFLSHLIDTYRPVFPVYVSVGSPERFPHAGADELVDLRPGMGPLAGLETAFQQTDAELVFLTATDLPFGTADLAQTLVERISDADACVIRRQDGTVEPTFAVYRRSCLPALSALLDQNRRAVQALLNCVRVCWVPEETLEGVDLDRVLRNINTPEQYDALFAAL